MSIARSMTGFARITKAGAEGDVTVNLRSLNHRGLDIHFHIPSELDPFEPALRGVVKRKVLRGHIEVRVTFASTGPASPLRINRPMLQAYLDVFEHTAREHRLSCQPDLNAALRLPGMFVDTAPGEPSAGIGVLLGEAMEEALDALNTFREREGVEIAQVLKQRNAALRAAVEQIRQIRAEAVPAFQTRLTERLNELLRGSQVEPQRLVQEAAILADRSDIGEEIARLEIHSRQLEELLDSGGEIGKKLDFLLQEMNRETNTILSKTGGIGDLGLKITELALGAKADIEKIREQSLNLE